MRRAAFAIILAYLCATAATLAQVSQPGAGTTTTTDTDLTAISDFRPLFQERDTLSGRIRELEQGIEEQSAKVKNLPPADQLQGYLDRAKSDLAREQKAARPDQQRIDSIQRYIETTTADLRLAATAGPQLQNQRAENERARRRLFAVEQRIASLFDATREQNRFKSTTTYTFGVLVFIVVMGFYLIAWKKEGVATTIFAGELGMQFVTLFLIVIAIILFGIMGTLEGRELSALLGGLSGYILGRVDRRPDVPISQLSHGGTPVAGGGSPTGTP